MRGDCVQHTVPVPARIAVLPYAGRPGGRRGQVSVVSEELHGRRSTNRTINRQKLRVKLRVYNKYHSITLLPMY